MVQFELPYFVSGEVVKGFGRGSKDLGCPTANFDLSVVQTLPQDVPTGVYCGWAQIDKGPVYKMVANIGWCPYYQNKEISIETHILNKFDKDFYGSMLRICVYSFLRPEMNFDSMDALISQIKQDIQDSKNLLDAPEAQELMQHPFFVV